MRKKVAPVHLNKHTHAHKWLVCTRRGRIMQSLVQIVWLQSSQSVGETLRRDLHSSTDEPEQSDTRTHHQWFTVYEWRKDSCCLIFTVKYTDSLHFYLRRSVQRPHTHTGVHHTSEANIFLSTVKSFYCNRRDILSWLGWKNKNQMWSWSNF